MCQSADKVSTTLEESSFPTDRTQAGRSRLHDSAARCCAHRYRQYQPHKDGQYIASNKVVSSRLHYRGVVAPTVVLLAALSLL